MNLAKYRDTNDYREILRLFQKSSEYEGSLLWQNIKGQRKVFSISYLEIDFVGRDVVVYLDNPQDVSPDQPLYSKLSYNDTIFKVEDFFVQQDCLSFKFPATLKTWEMRTSERFLLDDNDEHSVVLSVSGKADSSQQLKVSLKDFSAKGLGLSISELNKHLIKNNKIFWIHAIDGYRFIEPLQGTVTHLNKENQGRKFRFGIHLQKVLPIEAVRSILN